MSKFFLFIANRIQIAKNTFILIANSNQNVHSVIFITNNNQNAHVFIFIANRLEFGGSTF